MRFKKRLEQAGIEIIEARLSHLAYSPEVAGSMLKLQQASAVIAARQKIVEGAVSMVDLVLKKIASKRMAKLTSREKARLVSDLLVVLCGDKEAAPVISVGGVTGGTVERFNWIKTGVGSWRTTNLAESRRGS